MRDQSIAVQIHTESLGEEECTGQCFGDRGTAAGPQKYDDYIQHELTELAQLGENGGCKEICGIRWKFEKLNKMPRFRRAMNIRVKKLEE